MILNQRIVHLEKQLKDKEVQLEDSNLKKQLLEAATDSVFLHDFNGNFIYANEAAYETRGYSYDELMGMNLHDLDVPKYALLFETYNKELIEKGESTFETAHYHKDGSVIPIEIRARIVKSTGEDLILSVARDITLRKNYEKKLEADVKRRTAELERLNLELQKRDDLTFKLSSLNQEFLSPISLEEKLKLITDSLVTIFEADFARIWLTRKGDLCQKGCIHADVTEGPHICVDRSLCLHLVASSGRYTHIDGDHRRVPMGSYKIGRIAAGLEFKFVTNDVTHDPQVHDHKWAKELGLVSFAGFKLSSDEGKPVGVLALFKKTPLDHDSELFLEDLANTTSQVIIAGMAEKALLASEARYRALFENSGTAMLFIEEDLTISMINKECEKLSGYSIEETEGKMKWTELVANKEDLGQMKEYHKLRRTDPDAVPSTYDFQLLDKKGNIKDVIATVSMIPGTNRSLAAVLDITQRKRVEKALRRSEEKFRNIIEESYDGFALFNEEGRIIEWNQAQERITGLKREDVLSRFMWDVTFQLVPEEHITPELYEIMKDSMTEMSRTGKISKRNMEHEMEIRRPDGSCRTVEIVDFPIRTDKGFIGSSITRDVTERKQAELALIESEENFRAIAENASEGILIAVGEGIHVYVNQMAAEITGYTIEELIKTTIADLTCPDELNKLMSIYKSRIGGKTVPSMHETSIVRKDGEVVLVEITGAKTVWKGQPADLVLIHDITERKKVEEYIKLQNKALEGINQIFKNAIIIDSEEEVAKRSLEVCEEITDSKFGFILERNIHGNLDALAISNPGWDECLMEKSDAIIMLKDMKEHGIHGKASKDGKSFFTNDPSHHEDSIGAPEGHPDLHSFLGVPLRINDEVIGSIGLGNKEEGYDSKDLQTLERLSIAISESLMRKRAENSLKVALVEKKMLLKEIHHRVKNNLMIISSLLNLQSGYIKDKESQDIFKESQNRARSMAIIHERLYQSTDLKRIDFGDYIHSLSTELFHTYEVDPGLVKLKINVEDIFLDINTAIPLGLIVNELVTNSLKHAFPKGKKGEINVDFHPKDDHYEFTVKDNGIGFPEDIDFQNTDSLGLQIVNSLTNQIDGEIKLNRNNGTKFKITFKEPEDKEG